MSIKNRMVYLEDYADTLESLPLELSRSFTSIKELDSISHNITGKTQEQLIKFLNDSGKMSKADKVDRIKELMNLLQECLEHGEEKVELAMKAYDLTDRHLNRLHDDLQKFQSEQMSSPKVHGAPGSRTIRKSELRKSGPVPRYSNANLPARLVSAKDRGKLADYENVHVGKVLEDVDNNEPRYCYCGGPSFGNMVACDNKDCDIEWFHYICVGLNAPPKGQWYCKECLREMKK